MIRDKLKGCTDLLSVSNVEKAIAGVLFLVVFTAFFYADYQNYYNAHLDSVYMVENIESTYAQGSPTSHVNKTAHDAIATVIKMPAEKVCGLPLKADHEAKTPVFERHAYLSLYLMAPFHEFFSGRAIAAFINALIFVGLGFLVYFLVRTEGQGVGWALLFVLLLLAHAAWSESVYGQWYPDRLFLLFGFMYAYLIYKRLSESEVNDIALISLALLAISIHERVALMIAAITIAFLVLYRGWRGWQKNDLVLLLLALMSASYAYVYMHYFQQNSDYASFSSQVTSFFSVVQNNEPFRLKLEKFLLINAPLLILSLFEWRLALIAIAMMVPNMVGSIGGAEKTGWSTHYHSMYFPILLFAACMGYIRILGWLNSFRFKVLFFLFPAVMAAALMCVDPYSLSPLTKMSYSNVKHNALLKTIRVARGAKLIRNEQFKAELVAEIPEGAVVSTSEGLVPILYDNHIITEYYPLGLENSDYIVLPYMTNDDSELFVYGAVSYLGKKNLDAMNRCLNKRITDAGYIEHKMIPTSKGGRSGFVILKRVQSRGPDKIH